MLGLKAKDHNTTFSQLNKDLNNKELVGVRLDSDSAIGIRAEPALLEPAIDGKSFSTQVLLTPTKAQLGMLRDLNGSLIDSGVGSILWTKQDTYSPMDSETGEEVRSSGSIGSFQDVSRALEITDELTYDCNALLLFDSEKQMKKTTYKVTKGVELTVYMFTVTYLDTYVTLYIALMEKEYDGQTLLGSLSGKTLKRLETIKFLKVIEDSAFFGRRIIGVMMESKSGAKHRLLDTTDLGIVARVADIDSLDDEPYVAIFSGESNLMFKHTAIKNSDFVEVDKYTRAYKLVINLQNGEQIEVYFG